MPVVARMQGDLEKLNKTIEQIEQRSGQIVTVFVVLTIILGTAYSIYLGDKLRFLPDEADYVRLAENVAQLGIYSLDGHTPTAYRAPGYPLTFVPLAYLGIGIVGYRVLNFVWLAGCIYMVSLILREQSTRFSAVLGAGWVFLYPVQFYTAGALYPQTLAALLLLLLLYNLTKKRRPISSYLTAGIAAGLLCLTTPTAIFIVGMSILWVFLTANKKFSHGLMVFVLSALVVIGAWTVRNYLVFGDLIPVSTNSGENLLVGNSENASPNSGRTTDISIYERAASGLNEVAKDRYYRSAALAYIQANKLDVVKLYFQKFLNYFNYQNRLVTKGEGTQLRDMLMLVSYGILLGFFILRMFLLKRYPPTRFELLIIFIYLLNSLITAIFFTRIRFRLPFDFLLIINAAMVLGKIIYKFIETEPQTQLNSRLLN